MKEKMKQQVINRSNGMVQSRWITTRRWFISIEAVASNSGGETKQTAAVFIDRTAPKLTHEVDQENLVIRGKVDDILLNWMTESGWVARNSSENAI